MLCLELLFVLLVLALSAEAKEQRIVTTSVRLDMIQHAIVWHETSHNISTRNMTKGPKNDYKIQTGDTVECDFAEPSKEDPEGGPFCTAFICR